MGDVCALVYNFHSPLSSKLVTTFANSVCLPESAYNT
jgi:hypothetical protein